jgi:hypothetical protein
VRYLALVRYRYLLTCRSAAMTGTFWVVFGLMLLPCAFLLLGWTVLDPGVPMADTMRVGAMGTAAAFLIHALAMLVATCALALSARGPDNASISDLLDTAPVPVVAGMWGDTLGVFGAALTIHGAMLPILCFAVAMGPFSTSTFFLGESLMVLSMLVTSAAGAWSLRSETWRDAAARLSRGLTAALLASVVAVVLLARSLAALREALAWFGVAPGPAAADALLSVLRGPAMLLIALGTVVAAFMAYVTFDAARRAASA